MNRAERRRGRWNKLNPHLDYDGLVKSVGGDGPKLMMAMLRQLAGEDAPFDDRELWNSVRELINNGLLNVYFRFGLDGIEVRPEFLIPTDNDNQRQAGAA